jgi:hypothetical protein
MGFSLCVLSGIAVIGFTVARFKARRSQKRNVLTLFNVLSSDRGCVSGIHRSPLLAYWRHARAGGAELRR